MDNCTRTAALWREKTGIIIIIPRGNNQQKSKLTEVKGLTIKQPKFWILQRNGRQRRKSVRPESGSKASLQKWVVLQQLPVLSKVQLYQKWFYRKVFDATNGGTCGTRKKENTAVIRQVSPILLLSPISFAVVRFGGSRSRAEVCRACCWWDRDGFATVSLVFVRRHYHNRVFG